LVGKPEGKRPLGRPSVDGRITLRWTLGWEESMGRTGFGWLRIGSNGELLRTFGFHKESRLLFDKLSDYQLFK
jgi:hypothetical protein